MILPAATWEWADSFQPGSFSGLKKELGLAEMEDAWWSALQHARKTVIRR